MQSIIDFMLHLEFRKIVYAVHLFETGNTLLLDFHKPTTSFPILSAIRTFPFVSLIIDIYPFSLCRIIEQTNSGHNHHLIFLLFPNSQTPPQKRVGLPRILELRMYRSQPLHIRPIRWHSLSVKGKTTATISGHFFPLVYARIHLLNFMYLCTVHSFKLRLLVTAFVHM